jgi:hypothetical protein
MFVGNGAAIIDDFEDFEIFLSSTIFYGLQRNINGAQ